MDNFDIRKINVENAVKSFRNISEKAYIDFLDSLSFEEKEAYFYIEAKRGELFINELCGFENLEIRLSEFGKYKEIIAKKLHYELDAVENLLNFYSCFGCLEPPSLTLRQKVIENYTKYHLELMPIEVQYFLEC